MNYLCDLYACVVVAYIKRNIEGAETWSLLSMMESL